MREVSPVIEYASVPVVGYPPPPKPRRPIGFLVLLGVLSVAATVFAVLYVLADRDRDLTDAALAARRTELTTAARQSRDAETDQAAIEQDNGDLADDNASLRTCVDAVQRYLWDNLAGEERKAALNRMFDVCD